jgi:hypothetical protein
MRRDAPSLLKPAYKPLPYTTEYGKFWQVWMTFRELESNTRDEAGETVYVEDGDVVGVDGETRIVIDLPEYVAAWTFRDETFLPNATRIGVTGVEALKEGPRDKLYWRGLRVKDLPKPAVRTWNLIGPQKLTEDRTLQSEWSARYDIAMHVSQSDDEELIRDVICADAKYWEHRLDWPTLTAPSETFKRVALQYRSQAHGVRGYVESYMPRRPRKSSPWEDARRPWKIEEDDDDQHNIVDARGRRILTRPNGFDAEEWEELAAKLCEVVNGKSASPTI